MKIDPEIQNYIPAPSLDELSNLESLLKSEGCRDALIRWKEQDTLLDGHNRHSICERLGIGYRVTDLSFADRDDALIWVIRNQFGRRNLNDFQRADLALKLEPLIRVKAKSQQGRRNDIPQNSAECSTPIETRNEIAKSAGVSHDTIGKVKHIKEDADPEIKKLVESGEVSINAAAAVSTLPSKEQKKVAAGGAKSVRETASKLRKSKKAADPVPTPSPSLTDSQGAAIPENALIKNAFEAVPVFETAIQSIATLKSSFTKLAAPSKVLINFNELNRDLDNVSKHLKAAKPHAICPYCKASGRACNCCKGRGWVGKHEYNTAPADLKVGAK